MALLLGIDTGGTFTDAVLFDEERGIVATAKDLTTKHDLSIGVRGAIAKVLEGAATVEPAEIALVSLSTTLATNAVVESQGFPVAMVMIGLKESALERGGLKNVLGRDPVLFVGGGHDNFGGEQASLDEAALVEGLEELRGRVSAAAVCSFFAVRNASHETRAREIIRECLDLPVTCTHELTSSLDAPRRALTALFNARLVPLIQQLVLAVEGMLRDRGIEAPLMVVKGDGSLVSEATALLKPVETILSGPAASVVGAQFLSGRSDAVISDIGGTTTDIAILAGGNPALAREGATVAGHRTMVEAVAVHTVGLGGDSEIRIDEEIGLVAGPRRAIPLSLLATQWEDLVLETLRGQAARSWPKRADGRFLVKLRDLPPERLGGLTKNERAIWDMIQERPRSLEDILEVRVSDLPRRLLDQGLAIVSAFTPTDAAHLLGLHEGWHEEAARLGAALWARQEQHNGKPISESGAAFARRVFDLVTLQSAEAIAAAVLLQEAPANMPPAKVLPPRAFLRAALGEGGGQVLRFSALLDRPVVGIGAPAETYYDEVARRLGVGAVVPPNFEVCNAVGAVCGGVSQKVVLLISSPQEGLYRLHGAEAVRDFNDLEAAVTAAESEAGDEAARRAREAGAAELRVDLERDDRTASLGGGLTVFMESRITATAFGRPRLGL